MATSENGDVAVIDKIENCVTLFGKGTLNGVEHHWTTRKLTNCLSRPFDICFGPNDHLLVSDNGDASLKTFHLNRNQLVNQIVIGHDCNGKLVVQDSTRREELTVRFKTFRRSTTKHCTRSRTFIPIVCVNRCGYSSYQHGLEGNDSFKLFSCAKSFGLVFRTT